MIIIFSQFQTIRHQKPGLPATTIINSSGSATVISTSRVTPASTVQTINPAVTATSIRAQQSFPNMSQSQGQIPQPTVLTQRQGIPSQITVQPVPSKGTAPTQLTSLPPGVTILRPQQMPVATSIHSTGQATQIINPGSGIPTSAAAVVSAIRQPLPAAALQPVGPKVSISQASPLVQLPTQPIPANEIRTTKQVLLEPKAAAAKISVPSTSPRTTSITLPTQPVPRSAAMVPANAATASSVSVTSVVNVRSLPRSQVLTPASVIQTMLPNQPLPMTTAYSSCRPGSTIATAATMSVPTTLQYTTGFGTTASHATHLFPSNAVVSSPLHSPNPSMVTITTGPPRLPQHPLPPTTTSTTACKIEPVEMQPQSQPRTVVALKKRDIMMTKDLQNEMKTKEDVVIGMAKASIQSQPEYLKPRDAYGGGAHLRLQQPASDVSVREEKPMVYQQSSQSTPAVTIIPGQPPSSTASYPPSHLQMLQAQQEMMAQDLNLYYQEFLKQGQPEHMAKQLAQQMVESRYATLKSELVLGPARPGSVPPPMDSYRPPSRPDIQPPMAHAPSPSISVTGGPGQPPDAFLRQSDSPLAGAPAAAHAHSRIPYTLGHPDHARSTPDHIIQSYRQTSGSSAQEEIYHRASLEPSPASPTTVVRAPSPVEFVLPNFESYPVVWQGHLGLKTEIATVQFHYVSGCKDLARASLPTAVADPRMELPTLKIGQRMRLEESQLSGVQRKMLQSQEHCVLLALPCGKDNLDVEAQSRQLRNHFITYLQLKSAAGIVNVEENGAAYVVHVFPSCDFANETMSGIAPDLLARVAEIEHMVIIIATVFDNK